jgi:hypothetical protein
LVVFCRSLDKVKLLGMECLGCLATILEHGPLEKSVGKSTEELLGYLKSVFNVDPLWTLKCVQSLLRCIFG